MTQDELKARLHYCPTTGVFTWLVRAAHRIQIGDVAGYQRGAYVFIRVMGKLHYAHRLAVLYMIGEWPIELVDHDNQNKSDNRWSNLVMASPTKNRQNARRSKNNSSGVTGVHWDKVKKAWAAVITLNYKAKFLGYFDNIPAAANARKAAEQLHGFNPNHGRTA